MTDGPPGDLSEEEAAGRLAELDERWQRDEEDRRKNPALRERLDLMRQEYAVLARRNWTKINKIHDGYERQNERVGKTLRVVLVVLAVLFVANVVLGFVTVGLLSEPAKGRRFSIGVSCAVESAAAKAGRDILLQQTAGPETKFDRNLERLGYPPKSVRDAQAQVAAREYVGSIASAAEQQVGAKGGLLIRKDGTIDCARLLKFANAAR